MIGRLRRGFSKQDLSPDVGSPASPQDDPQLKPSMRRKGSLPNVLVEADTPPRQPSLLARRSSSSSLTEDIAISADALAIAKNFADLNGDIVKAQRKRSTTCAVPAGPLSVDRNKYLASKPRKNSIPDGRATSIPEGPVSSSHSASRPGPAPFVRTSSLKVDTTTPAKGAAASDPEISTPTTTSTPGLRSLAHSNRPSMAASKQSSGNSQQANARAFASANAFASSRQLDTSMSASSSPRTASRKYSHESSSFIIQEKESDLEDVLGRLATQIQNIGCTADDDSSTPPLTGGRAPLFVATSLIASCRSPTLKSRFVPSPVGAGHAGSPSGTYTSSYGTPRVNAPPAVTLPSSLPSPYSSSSSLSPWGNAQVPAHSPHHRADNAGSAASSTCSPQGAHTVVDDAHSAVLVLSALSFVRPGTTSPCSATTTATHTVSSPTASTTAGSTTAAAAAAASHTGSTATTTTAAFTRATSTATAVAASSSSTAAAATAAAAAAAAAAPAIFVTSPGSGSFSTADSQASDTAPTSPPPTSPHTAAAATTTARGPPASFAARFGSTAAATAAAAASSTTTEATAAALASTWLAHSSTTMPALTSASSATTTTPATASDSLLLAYRTHSPSNAAAAASSSALPSSYLAHFSTSASTEGTQTSAVGTPAPTTPTTQTSTQGTPAPSYPTQTATSSVPASGTAAATTSTSPSSLLASTTATAVDTGASPPLGDGEQDENWDNKVDDLLKSMEMFRQTLQNI